MHVLNLFHIQIHLITRHREHQIFTSDSVVHHFLDNQICHKFQPIGSKPHFGARDKFYNFPKIFRNSMTLSQHD